MTEGLTLFFDSAPIIYLVEKNPAFLERVKMFLYEAIEQDCMLLTSVLIISEVLVKPQKLNKIEVLDQFESTIKTLFEVRPITWDIAKLSATLRSKYAPLKAIDSFQIASAVNAKCDGFVTNDRRLKFIKEIPIILIRDL
jgi:predicted nucleic acid-binding protein